MPRTLRLDEDTEALIAIAAGAKRQSINAWINEAIRAALIRQGARLGPHGVALAAELDRRAGRASR